MERNGTLALGGCVPHGDRFHARHDCLVHHVSEMGHEGTRGGAAAPSRSHSDPKVGSQDRWFVFKVCMYVS